MCLALTNFRVTEALASSQVPACALPFSKSATVADLERSPSLYQVVPGIPAPLANLVFSPKVNLFRLLAFNILLILETLLVSKLEMSKLVKPLS